MILKRMNLRYISCSGENGHRYYTGKKINVKCGLNIDNLSKLLYSEDIMAQTKKKSEHYVNNKEFLAAMVEYRKSVNKAKREKRNKPPVTDYIGSCFLKIANHLSYRPNFINYTFRDDMISDGIEN